MKLGDIKIEALKIMFVNYNYEINIDTLDRLKNDENINSYLINMPGAINRCFSVIEEKRILPTKRYDLKIEEIEKTIEQKGNLFYFNLDKLIDDYFDIERVVRVNENEYDGNVEYIMEGSTLILPIEYFAENSPAEFSVIYYPSINRIASNTSNEDEIDVPDKIATHIPYFIKGELYRDDEPNEANEARSWFEQAMAQIQANNQRSFSKIKNVYSQMEM